jgi:2-iminobutanoate/2-iminopropanoate deaminase
MFRFVTVLCCLALPLTMMGCEQGAPEADTTIAAAPIHEAVASPDMPRALGPYSHAILTDGFLFTSGQVGVNAETGEIPEGFEAQARLTFENLSRVLQASGSGMEHVVKTTVFMADATQFEAMNVIFAEYFPTRPPVRSTPIVQLPRGLLISVDAMAVAPPRQQQ